MKGNITVRSHHGRSCIAKSIFACYYKIVYILVKIAVETNVCVIGIIPDHAIGRLYTTEAPGMLKIAA